MKLEIAVLSGGNGSFAAAADFTRAGHNVRLWRRDPAVTAAHRAGGGIVTAKDFSGRTDTPLSLITSNIEEALNGAALVVCPAPAFAQADIARHAAPHLADGQVVFLPPGTFGSLIFAKAQYDASNNAATAFAETGTLPWLARKHGPYEVAITVRAKHLPTGVFPLSRSERAFAVLSIAFPDVIEPCGDILSAALMNAGPIIHPPLITMNAGPIEHFPRWDIHKEGTQPAIRRVTDALDAERIAVRAALGYGPPHFPLANHYAQEGTEWMYGRGSHDRLTESGDWHEALTLTSHRYMVEDTKLGLSFLASVADLVGVSVPLARGFLAIGSAICGENFLASGRTLAQLGLGGLSVVKIQKLLQEGFT